MTGLNQRSLITACNRLGRLQKDFEEIAHQAFNTRYTDAVDIPHHRTILTVNQPDYRSVLTFDNAVHVRGELYSRPRQGNYYLVPTGEMVDVPNPMYVSSEKVEDEIRASIQEGFQAIAKGFGELAECLQSLGQMKVREK